MVGAFKARGLQIAGGVPFKLDHEVDSRRLSFRLGLFGLDKMQHVDRTVEKFRAALDAISNKSAVIRLPQTGTRRLECGRCSSRFFVAQEIHRGRPRASTARARKEQHAPAEEKDATDAKAKPHEAGRTTARRPEATSARLQRRDMLDVALAAYR